MQAVYSVAHPPIASDCIMQLRQAVEGGHAVHEEAQWAAAQLLTAAYAWVEVPPQVRAF